MSLTKNFDKLNRGNKGEGDNPDATQDIEEFNVPAHARNLCFVQPDGRRLFLNYSYLIAGEYLPESNTIILSYTTHEITLTGRNLAELYEGLMLHMVKLVTAIDKRYEATKTDEEPVVTEIAIAKP
ncbi:MAG: hypothetical protein DI539_10690 [Flavobacterium psychrophilum]|nr:MAG: hypothetical protein DI539_10690 [Flavobacterium psychrophilum]